MLGCVLSERNLCRPLGSLPLRNLSTQPIVGALIAALTLACGCSAQSHLETNYADTSAVGARLYFFGDPFGIRSALAHKGITFIFESITDAMGVAHGGLSDQPAAYTRIRGTFDIDFGRLTGSDNGLSFHATGLWQTGDNIGPKLGSYADPSGFASVHVFRMDSFWLQKQFDGGAITLRAGQMAGWDFFGNQEYGGSFTIESLSYAPGNIFGATYLTFNPAECRLLMCACKAFGEMNVPSGESMPSRRCSPATRTPINKTPPVCTTSSPTRRSSLRRLAIFGTRRPILISLLPPIAKSTRAFTALAASSTTTDSSPIR